MTKKEIEKIPYPPGKDFMKKMLLTAKKALAEASPSCREKAVENFIVNYFLKGAEKREAFFQKHAWWPPYLFVMSPTMRCNLRCYGCYAASYSKGRELSRETIDRVLKEAREIGIYEKCQNAPLLAAGIGLTRRFSLLRRHFRRRAVCPRRHPGYFFRPTRMASFTFL